jgi:hypothetical protein
MGKKARGACAACGVSFKQRGGADKHAARFCGATCAAAGAGADEYYGDIPPAFAGAAIGTNRNNTNRNNDYSYGSYGET